MWPTRTDAAQRTAGRTTWQSGRYDRAATRRQRRRRHQPRPARRVDRRPLPDLASDVPRQWSRRQRRNSRRIHPQPPRHGRRPPSRASAASCSSSGRRPHGGRHAGGTLTVTPQQGASQPRSHRCPVMIRGFCASVPRTRPP
ncbi:hypothetical protein OG309_04195 [Streptomyces sp. NBC_01268]